jgi:hypothetical protein
VDKLASYHEGAAMKAKTAKSPQVLVVDIGGTNVKMLATGQKEPRKYPSGPTMTPRKMVRLVKKSVRNGSSIVCRSAILAPLLMAILFASHTTWVGVRRSSTSEKHLAAP